MASTLTTLRQATKAVADGWCDIEDTEEAHSSIWFRFADNNMHAEIAIRTGDPVGTIDQMLTSCEILRAQIKQQLEKREAYMAGREAARD